MYSIDAEGNALEDLFAHEPTRTMPRELQLDLREMSRVPAATVDLRPHQPKPTQKSTLTLLRQILEVRADWVMTESEVSKEILKAIHKQLVLRYRRALEKRGRR